MEAVRTFEKAAISPIACQNNAQRFANARFRQELTAFVSQQYEAFIREQNI